MQARGGVSRDGGNPRVPVTASGRSDRLLPMKPAAILLALALQAGAGASAPLPAQQGCENMCPEGMVYSVEERRCVPLTPMV